MSVPRTGHHTNETDKGDISMKKRLYLVRHGETLFNQQKRIQGWCDSPLTEKGIAQAKSVHDYFEERGILFDAAYSSSSERCTDTLECITDMAYTRLKGLKEMNYGALEAHPEYLAENDPVKCETYYLQFGGESSLTVRERMLQTLTSVMEKEENHTVLAVSHGGACFNFLKRIDADLSYLAGGSTNAGIFILDYEDGKFTLVEFRRNPIQ